MGYAAIGLLLARGWIGDELPDWPWTAAWLLVFAGALATVVVIPEMRWRRWRYEVREEEIDLRRGTFTMVRTLVPMARVQHVDTRAGVLEQALNVSTVVFHTAAGTTAIPALHFREAERVRDRIATLAQAPDTV